MLTQQYYSVHCLDEYTSDWKYYKTYSQLTEIPTDIPAEALEVHLYHNEYSKIEANIFFQLLQCEKTGLE